MKGLRKLLIEEYLRLEKIAGKLRKELADMPEGTLRVSKSHNYTQFYHVKKENDMKCQKFLQKSEMDFRVFSCSASQAGNRFFSMTLILVQSFSPSAAVL